MGRLLAITPNFTIDHIISLDRLTPGEVHRANMGNRIPGGKGVNVARIARQLGHNADISGFLAGRNGHFAAEQFNKEGFTGHYVWYDGETRTSILIDEPDGRTTVINERGTFIDREHVAQLSTLIQGISQQYQWVSLSGSILPGASAETYRGIFTAAHPAQIALDSHGDALTVLSQAKPDLLRVNGIEASALLGKSINSVETARNACHALQTWGIDMVVISLGELGAVGCRGLQDWYIPSPPITAISTVGAGDAMFGTMLATLMDGAELSEALRRGVAAGAACCTIRDVGKLPVETYEHLLKVTRC